MEALCLLHLLLVVLYTSSTVSDRFSIMPKSKRVASLYNLSLECVKDSILKSAVAAAAAKASAIEWGNEVICFSTNQHNVFHQLPTALLEDIIKSLTPFSDVYCSPYARYSNYMQNSHKVWCIARKSVLKHLYTSKLQTLWILNFFDDFLKFLPHYENLKVLHFSMNVASDSCLRTLGACCKQLRVLDVSRSPVTDTGIKWFCLGFEHEGIKYGGKCKSIQSLYLKSTKVTKIGILTCLRHLPVLRVLFHKLTFTVLAEIAKGLLDYDLPCRPSYSLSYLFVPKLPTYESASLELAISLCPSLTQVGINLDNGFTNNDIFCLTSLKMLRGLLFMKRHGSSEHYKLNFRVGIAPVLKVIGSALEYLEISYSDPEYRKLFRVNISTIIEFCPNLISLVIDMAITVKQRGNSFIKLSDNRYPIERKRYSEGRKILTELQYLYLGRNVISLQIPPDILLSLLSSPSLVDVRVLHSSTITDDVLLKAFELHGFQNLKCLELSGCGFITSKVIDVFFVDGNPLSRIHLSNCKNITKDNISDWLKIAEKKNWELEIFDSFSYISPCMFEDLAL